MQKRMNSIANVLGQFGIDAVALPHGNGHINNTFLVDSKPRVILQRINTNVFKNPERVMGNIMAVTAHLRKKIAEAGGDPARETLTFLTTKENLPYYQTAEGDYFRAYYFVEDMICLEVAKDPADFAEVAHAFGRFQRMLSDFPADRLHETIAHFHDTPNRFAQLEEAIATDRVGRAKSVEKEIGEVRKYAKYASLIVDGIADGTVPLRVTHNDTKLNNVLLDDKTRKGVCVIDLDTVMPGSLLYDFGDAMRTGASTGAEDEIDLDKVRFDLEKFEAFTAAFLEELGDSVTAKERELMPFSALIITVEQATRFLADYINGDVYFRTHREHHNLDRTRTQLKLAAEIEKLLPKMQEIVNKY